MSARTSAGLLMYRVDDGRLRVFFAHPGGPYFRKRDEGVWTIPKGLPEPGEDLLQTAQREFLEETGITPRGPYLELGRVTQRGGKTVHAWAFEGTWENGDGIVSNEFQIPWPPGSDRRQSFPEIDRASLFEPDKARAKANPAQAELIDRLEAVLDEEQA